MSIREPPVLLLHPDPCNPLGLDLKHILSTIGPKLADWVWLIKDLDCLGENGEPFCQAVEAASPEGFQIDSQDLVKAADGIYQTIEGEFLAFPRSAVRQGLVPLDLSLSSFSASQAVVAVDECYFDVYPKDAEVTDRLHERSPDVRIENPGLYF